MRVVRWVPEVRVGKDGSDAEIVLAEDIFAVSICVVISAMCADLEEQSMPLSGSPPPTSHVMVGEKVKDAASNVHVAATASVAAVNSGTVQLPPAASRLA